MSWMLSVFILLVTHEQKKGKTSLYRVRANGRKSLDKMRWLSFRRNEEFDK